MFLLIWQMLCRHKNRRCVHLREAADPDNFPRQQKKLVIAACLDCGRGFYEGRPQYCFITKKPH